MLILLSDAFDKSLPGRLERFGEVTDDQSRVDDAEVVLVRSKTKCTAEWMAGAPACRLIIRGGVGLDNVDAAAAKARGIKVHNTPAASSVSVAELAMALMIAVPNHLVEAHNGMLEGKFLKNEIKRTELFQKTLGLVGAGRIASEVGTRAAAFGMKVIAYDPFVKSSDVAEMVATIEDLFAQADYISLHVPLTDETKGMINRDSIGLMKDGAVIVNTGRGKCIVEEDVAEALKTGKLMAYATDVWYSDPPDPSSPILGAPNVYMTPHIGASSKENLGRIGDEVVKLLEEYTAGRA
jgi:D-3-phosphoglycerate dehydrogenase